MVAENVHAARTVRGWTRAELARQSGVAENTVKHIEEPDKRLPTKRGKVASPQLDVLDKLAHAMGYPTWQLLAENFDPSDKLAARPITERERKLHQQIADAYRKLDRSDFDGNDQT